MAAVYNGVIDQGADWYINFTYKDPSGNPINLTGYTAALQMRTSPLARTTVLSLTTGAGITITGSTGLVAVHATATQTAAIAPGKYSYDLEIANGGIVTRLIQGTMEVSANTTR